jgi:hypothetical protein
MKQAGSLDELKKKEETSVMQLDAWRRDALVPLSAACGQAVSNQD